MRRGLRGGRSVPIRTERDLKIMANRKAGEQNIRKLTKMGGKSLGLTLPVELLKELKWKEKQKVKVKRVRGGILIKDWKK